MSSGNPSLRPSSARGCWWRKQRRRAVLRPAGAAALVARLLRLRQRHHGALRDAAAGAGFDARPEALFAQLGPRGRTGRAQLAPPLARRPGAHAPTAVFAGKGPARHHRRTLPAAH